MKTRTVETIAEEFGYDEHELTAIFEMVADIMKLGAEKLEEKEPHATNAFRQLKDVSREIRSYDEFCDNHYLIRQVA